MQEAVNIERVRGSLEDFQAGFTALNARLKLHREPFTDDMLENILAAYRFLNELLRKDVNIFSLAGLHSMLELNHIVLCGTEPAKRYEYHRHVLETRKRFQQQVHKLHRWVVRQMDRLSPIELAVGFYWRALSQPQLYIEGNHRTGNIVLNYLLICNGEPPFVISSRNAYDYLEVSGDIKFSDKNKLSGSLFALPGHGKVFRRVLEDYMDHTLLQ